MKTKILLIIFVFIQFFSVSVYAQSFVYNDTISSGMWFQGTNGAEVVNPVSDAVNSSDSCAMSATDGNWQQIQYFPTYTPKSGEKLFFSVYNPNNAGPGQIQFEYSSEPGTWQYGADVTYEERSLTGWVEYSIDLSPHIGKEINKIILMPAGNNSAAVYVDNVYFGAESIIITVPQVPIVYNDTISSGMWFQGTNGAEVVNPVSNAVNSSDSCAMSATDGNWQQIQYFPTYTPKSGDKLFFSVYNPNNAGPGQIQFEYSSDAGTWQYGADVTYEESSLTGWVEFSIDLSAHVGNEINKIILMPAGDNSAAVYVDNIYFGAESILPNVSQVPIVYNDTISSGIWFQGTNGAEVANPVSDAVNSSDSCAMSATDGNWQQIQYFPTYTPKSEDKLFFSVYNPENAGPGQIQFEYSSEPGTWQWGDNVDYTAEAQSGWVEFSIDLSAHVGNEINKIILMPAGDNSAAVYVDNVYFGANTLITVSISEHFVNEHVYIDAYGKVIFDKYQTNTEMHVYDISGRLLIRETIRGNKSSAHLMKKGIYILKIRKGNKISGKKLIYN